MKNKRVMSHDEPARPTIAEASTTARLPDDVNVRAAALAVAIRVRKARGLVPTRRHRARTPAVLVEA